MIWILQNQDRVPAGRYDTLLTKLGRRHQTLQVHHEVVLPDLKQGDRLLVLGGTMGFDDGDRFPWLSRLQRLMVDAANADIPAFCICLGAQLLADGLGGTVTRNHNQERGISRIQLTEEGRDDPLMAGIPATFPAMQWHNDSFNLPPQAKQLARSSQCPVQAFRYRHAYGVQFHPEVNPSIVKNWNATLDPPGHYAEEFSFAQPDWQSTWDQLLINFLALDV